MQRNVYRVAVHEPHAIVQRRLTHSAYREGVTESRSKKTFHAREA